MAQWKYARLRPDTSRRGMSLEHATGNGWHEGSFLNIEAFDTGLAQALHAAGEAGWEFMMAQNDRWYFKKPA